MRRTTTYPPSSLALPHQRPRRPSRLAIPPLDDIPLRDQAALVVGQAAPVGDLDDTATTTGFVAVDGAQRVEVDVGVCRQLVSVDVDVEFFSGLGCGAYELSARAGGARTRC